MTHAPFPNAGPVKQIPFNWTTLGSLITAVTVVMLLTLPLGAETFDDFVYTSTASGATIRHYAGAGGDVDVPANINNVPVRTIANEAFSDNKSLTSVVVPETVTSIGRSAFANCTSLASVSLPDSVTSMGDAVFYGCSSLVNVTLPASLSTIPSLAFYNCIGLTNVSIPESVTTIKNSAFGRCSSLKSLSIPNSVTSIESGAFSRCTSLTSVSIPTGISTITIGLFSDCTALTSVSLPAGVTSVEQLAFTGCTAMRAYEVAEGNPAYRSVQGVLYNADGTVLVLYPSGLSGEYKVPPGVTTIHQAAFAQCAGLTGVDLPQSLSSIGNAAFQGCTGLNIVSTPLGLTSLGEGAFLGCSELTEIEISDSVTTIGRSAFYGCVKLIGVRIPASVTFIGDRAFSFCNSLTALEVDQANLDYRSTDGVLFNAAQTKLIYCLRQKSGHYVIPSTVTSIEDWAFNLCVNLVSVSIPDGITTIGAHTFAECDNLEGLVLPAGLTSIGEFAFAGRLKNSTLIIPAGVQAIGNYAFTDFTRLKSVKFMGNAPAAMTGLAFAWPSDDFTFYYYQGKTGFTSPKWQGHQSVALPVPEVPDTAITTEGGTVRVQFDGQAGRTYLLERKTQLTDTAWLVIGSTGPLVADQRLTLLDLSAPANHAFYRVRQSGP